MRQRRGHAADGRRANPNFLPIGASPRHSQVTQCVYTLLLKNGLHYKPTAYEIKHILTTATGENAPEADVELSKQNIHACVRGLARARAARPRSRANCIQNRW